MEILIIDNGLKVVKYKKRSNIDNDPGYMSKNPPPLPEIKQTSTRLSFVVRNKHPDSVENFALSIIHVRGEWTSSPKFEVLKILLIRSVAEIRFHGLYCVQYTLIAVGELITNR